MASKKIVIAAIIAVAIMLAYVGMNQGELSPQNTAIEHKDPYVTEYSLPPGSAPNGLSVDDDGLVWVATKNPVIYSIDPHSKQIQSYDVKDGSVRYLDTSANATMVWAMISNGGTIWFSPYGTSEIWKFDGSTHVFDAVASGAGAPFQMKSGPNGEVWFTTLRGNAVGVVEKMQNDTDRILTFGTGNHTNPAGLFLQNDSLWVAEVTSQSIVQYKIDRKDGLVKDILLARKIPRDNSTVFSSPTDLLVGKNMIWLTEHDTSFLTSYDLYSGKTVRYPTSPNGYHTTTLPFWIRGMHNPQVLWFNEHQGNKIGRFDLYNRTMTEYLIPSLPKDGYLTYPLNISQDPHDEKIVWFSEWNTDKVGVINGHILPPFGISLDVSHVLLSTGKDAVVDVRVSGNATGNVHLGASSTIVPTAEPDGLAVKFVPDASHDGMTRLHLGDEGVAAGNYTVGISASDGIVTITKFIDMSVS